MKIGSDIECFLRNSSDQIVNAASHIKYSKESPYTRENIKIYYDNVLAEFNIPPCESGKEFVINITNGLYLLRKLVVPHKLDFTASSIINEDVLNEKNMRQNTCVDEYDAYSLSVNNQIDNFMKTSKFRTSGGHIHIGSDDKNNNLLDPIVKPLYIYMLDLFLGITSVLLDKDMTQINRRTIFGKAGSYRPKSYGLEYRVLSSWWVSKPEYVALIFNLVEFVYYEMQEKLWEKFWSISEKDGALKYNCFGYDVDLVKNAINNCDETIAEKMLYFVYNFMPNELVKQINSIRKIR